MSVTFQSVQQLRNIFHEHEKTQNAMLLAAEINKELFSFMRKEAKAVYTYTFSGNVALEDRDRVVAILKNPYYGYKIDVAENGMLTIYGW